MIDLRRVHDDALVLLSESIAATKRLPHGWERHTDSMGVQCDLEVLVQLAAKAATFLPQDEMDRWLAPRLHACLRIPRRIATDSHMWAWLAFHCQSFVEERFKKGKTQVHSWRYRGAWSRNALSRLWWGAEMTRNGADYSAVDLCFARTRTAQFALELMYSWDRAACIAFCHVAEGTRGSPRLSDKSTNRLSTSLKTTLSLRSLDVFGSDTSHDMEEFDEQWAAHVPSFSALVQPQLSALRGPSNGSVSIDRVDEVISWFIEISRRIERLEDG